MSDSEKVSLFLRVDPKTRQWLNKLRKKQTGRVSQSTMAELIFEAAQKLGIFERGNKERDK